MRKAIILVFLVYLPVSACCQGEDLRDKLYRLEDRIISGDIDALRQLAGYIDDTAYVHEFLGWHSYPNTASGIATRVIKENCLFTNNEFKVDSTISASKFLKVVNSGKLVFDSLTRMFLLTTLEERNTSYQLKAISEYDLKRVDTAIGRPAYSAWYYENHIDSLFATKNPETLKWIASAWFHERSRFNRYCFNDDEFIDLIKKLTHVELGVPDEEEEITFLYRDDYYAKARLNFLIYWTNHYTDYRWNEKEQYFENIKESLIKKDKEDVLFELLDSDNDSIAMDAFTQLTELDTRRVGTLANDYEKNRADGNFSIPSDPFSFLRQLSKLTLYCRNTGVVYKPTGWLLASLEKLKDWDLKYAERYAMENDVIGKLTPSTVTMVEYLGLINEKDWPLGYSTGRILDKYYSKYWKDVIAEEGGLLLFLKKVKLFEHGISSRYSQKFENCSEELFKRVTEILKKTTDKDIKAGAKKVVDSYPPSSQKTNKTITACNDGEKYGVDNLRSEYEAILSKHSKKEDRVWSIKQLFARINYSQLAEAVKILMADKNWGQYDDPLWLIENDFGLEIESKSDSSVMEFLEVYESKTEYGVYEYYLNKKGLNCLDDNGNFIFGKVYDILKFDIVNSFANGSASRREDGVYPLIRLLELKFGTRLGFCEKLCGSKGVYTCSCDDRATVWMKYLEDNRLVKVNNNEPPSMTYYK